MPKISPVTSVSNQKVQEWITEGRTLGVEDKDKEGSSGSESEALLDLEGRRPLVLRNIDIGPCRHKWTVNYLLSVSPSSKLVKAHRSQTPQLDFRTKNFVYETLPFTDLVRNCSSSEGLEQDSSESEEVKEFWYLRSLGEDPRGKDVSDLSIHFPELYKDIKIPQVFHQSSFFSSVFRISSPGLQLWTHYDTVDNILIQVRGKKKVVLFPPWEALNLYLEGDKSQVLDIDPDSLETKSKFPKFVEAQRFETILEEGDILFIPSLWFHNVTALDFSISVNVFWKNLSLDLYDKKDTYGNRDPIPAALSFRTFDKATSQLKNLPKEYEDFYLRRMIISLKQKLDSLGLETKEKLETGRDN